MNIQRYRKEIVLLLDLFIMITAGSILFTILPDKNGAGCENYFCFIPHLFLLTACVIISQYLLRSYHSIWRYAQSKEYIKLLLSSAAGYVIFFHIDYFLLRSKIPLLFSAAVYSISLLLMLFMRYIYQEYRRNTQILNNVNSIPLVIIGAGEAGVKLQEEVAGNPNSRYHTVCFIDDSYEKIGKYIHNVEVKGPIAEMDKLLLDVPVGEIVIAIPSITPEKRKAILEICSSVKCRIRILPYTLSLLQNTGSLWNNVRDIRIEELLGREQVDFDNQEIMEFIKDKVVMVTGGGGSIGSELCRQIAQVKPRRIVIVDIYENNAYDIQQELRQIYGKSLELSVEIASIRDKGKVNRLFEQYHPDIIFHAAAHKHVPLMEDCPDEAIKNNIYGTYHLAMAADRYAAEKFVLISTDKAVNPTSIMGASKRFCEMIIQSMKEVSRTDFVAVRFGNVLGSNGSVIPLFQKQIALGGPVTVTDKRIVRYFMTIHEAVQLVLQAGAIANSGEIYVLDMGQPVKILELAENLIRLSGYVPYEEIPIIETGLRPGEKLYEELLMNSEELIATSNHKIYIELQKEITREELTANMEILHEAMETASIPALKKAMQQVIPTYKEPDEVNSNYHEE